MSLPEDFKKQLPSWFRDEKEVEEFLAAMDASSPVSVRLNPKKWVGDVRLKSQVPWCTPGYYMGTRPVFTLDPIFHAGGYYVQEASSMFIWFILESLQLDKTELKILDLSAAPGGKSTLMASWLGGKGLLVANEIVKNRAYTLKYNLMKEGYTNTVVTNNAPEYFGHISNFFDIILVDAPCSGEGMFRKDPEAVRHWSPDNVRHCAVRQQSVLKDIIPSLKDGGILIYSTCTYNHSENIDQADFLVSEYGMESVEINHPPSWGITEIHGKNSTGYQFYPHKTRGEGFFTSIFRNLGAAKKTYQPKGKKSNLSSVDKKEIRLLDDWVTGHDVAYFKDVAGTIHVVPDTQVDNILLLDSYLRMIYCGVSAGVINKNILIPDHSLALSYILAQNVPKIELETSSALKYLKKTLPAIDSTQKSWMVATFDGLNLGFLKNIGDRINNYLPNENKILMELPVQVQFKQKR